MHCTRSRPYTACAAALTRIVRALPQLHRGAPAATRTPQPTIHPLGLCRPFISFSSPIFFFPFSSPFLTSSLFFSSFPFSPFFHPLSSFFFYIFFFFSFSLFPFNFLFSSIPYPLLAPPAHHDRRQTCPRHRKLVEKHPAKDIKSTKTPYFQIFRLRRAFASHSTGSVRRGLKMQESTPFTLLYRLVKFRSKTRPGRPGNGRAELGSR